MQNRFREQLKRRLSISFAAIVDAVIIVVAIDVLTATAVVLFAVAVVAYVVVALIASGAAVVISAFLLRFALRCVFFYLVRTSICTLCSSMLCCGIYRRLHVSSNDRQQFQCHLPHCVRSVAQFRYKQVQ